MKFLKWLKKAKEFVSGYKTYVVCFTTITGLVVAYSENAITAYEFYQGVAAAIALVTLRAGMKKAA